jgi:hypothetical protein
MFVSDKFKLTNKFIGMMNIPLFPVVPPWSKTALDVDKPHRADNTSKPAPLSLSWRTLP